MAPIAGRRIHPARFPRSRARRETVKALLGGPADVVLSDMAANATGHRKTDHLKIMALAEAAADSPARCWRPAALSLQGAAGRHRDDAAGRAQARFRQREARQAGGEPRRFGRALSAWRRVSRPDCRSGVAPPRLQTRFRSFGSAASVGPAAGGAVRAAPAPPRRRPASARTRRMRSRRSAAIARKAGWKSAAAVMLDWPRAHNVRSTASAPIATPTEIDTCWATRPARSPGSCGGCRRRHRRWC